MDDFIIIIIIIIIYYANWQQTNTAHTQPVQRHNDKTHNQTIYYKL